MVQSPHTIERLTLPASEADIRSLARLLVDAVASGAAVSFLAPLTLDDAEAWWRRTLSGAHTRAIFLVARDAEQIAGTVQLHPAWAPNQPHRGEIVKLLVDRRSRGSGLGARLMKAIEETARAERFDLLTLDAKRGAAAERLYRRTGWIEVGAVPAYALDPDGTRLHDAVVFYKRLRDSSGGESGGEIPAGPYVRRGSRGGGPERGDLTIRPFAPPDRSACEGILRTLPEWFGLEAPLRRFVDELDVRDTDVASRDGAVAGFITIKPRAPTAAEITVMAVRREIHGQGVGGRLLDHAEGRLRARGVRFLQVKTLGPSRPDEGYAKTRRFYSRRGFEPLEETTALWGPENPCLIMVKWL